MVEIVIWTAAAANWVRRRSRDEEPVAGTVLLDDDNRGSLLHRGDDEDATDCGIVDLGLPSASGSTLRRTTGSRR